MIFDYIRRQLGVKLFLLLTTLLFLAIAPLSSIVFSTFAFYADAITELNRQHMGRQAHGYLAALVKEQAHKHDAYFSKVASASSLLAAQATEIYNNLNHYGSSSRMMGDLAGASMLSPGQISYMLSTELTALSQLEPAFKGVSEEIAGAVRVHLESVTGIGSSIDEYGLFATGFEERFFDLSGNGLAVDPIAIYRHQDNELTSTFWTGESAEDRNRNLLISARSTVQDSKGRLRAVVGIDIPLGTVVGDILAQDGEELETMRGEYFSFLLDPQGYVIAFPAQYREMFGIDNLTQGGRDNSALFSHNLSNSTVDDIARSVPALLNDEEAALEVILAGNTYILSMHTLHQLDWHLVLVARQADLQASLSETREVIAGTVSELTRKFMVVGVLLIGSVLLIVLFAVAYFISPLKRLSLAARKVGEGDLATRCELGRDDELGKLAESFNSMVGQLENAEYEKRKYAQKLEAEVQERVQDLRQKNIQLREVITELNHESRRRQQAVIALEQSKEQIRVAMDNSLAGHVIVQEGKLKYANPSVLRIFGYSEDEAIGGELEVIGLVVSEQRERMMRNLDVEQIKGTKRQPFVVSCLRRDGTVFDALVGTAATLWGGKPAVVAAVMDLTEQIKVEEELRESKRRLQTSLAEKEVLLREVYHRTKNNMLVIISMLSLQSSDIRDPRVENIFKETENRIRAMSLVHEMLYKSQNLTEVKLGDYLKEMATTLVGSMVIDDRVIVSSICETEVPISIDAILPLGLAVNELVTNSVRHGYPGERKGNITLGLQIEDAAGIHVWVSDDGVGLPENFDYRKIRSFGLQMTRNLVEKQLSGTLDIVRAGGTTVHIRFRDVATPINR